MKTSRSRKTSYCRLCPASCGVLLDLEDNQIVRVLGDAHHPISGGYTCAKGRRGADLARGPDRLTSSLRRTDTGTHVPVSVPEAVTDIAARLKAVVDEHGPESVAMFMGTQQNFAALTPPMARAWFRGTGSHKLFSTMTIDQSAKWVVQERMGTYLGGRQRFETADVWLLAGTNTLVSANGGDGDGAVVQNPSVTLREARERGLRLIVVDPRRTETAARADLHLAPRPGTDAVLFAGMLNLVLSEELYDHDFCRQYAGDLPELAAAVAGATPQMVERVCSVPEDHVRTAARMFASASRGMATTGTGVCMGPHSNLAEHLVAALNVVCGRYLREGEPVDDRSALGRSVPARAEVSPPERGFETGFRSRIGGIRAMRGELPSGILADEILEDGPDRIRALVVSGGNPAAALPDRAKAVHALESLDLLVCVDPLMSDTARLADYVIAPTMMYERDDHTMLMEAFFPIPFAQYTSAVVEAPSGAVDDWRFFFDLAAASGQSVKFAGRVLDPDNPPTSLDALAMLAERGRVPFDDLRVAQHGYVAGHSGSVVGPASPEGSGHRLRLLPDDVSAELVSLLSESVVAAEDRRFPMRLTVRRIREAMNSVGTALDGLVPGGHNPAHLNPEDLARLGVNDGDLVMVRSKSGQLKAVARSDRTVPSGVVSMTHCFGDLDPDADPRSSGSNVNLLTGRSEGAQAINAMPTMTAVPVAVYPLSSALAK
ncbi:molybdopterin-dependent oxidoreductase [Rhodococcus sp. KBS0724]|uniref:molybdopterin-containing oxidoreductase family protein n=1 Tax=Rhodococcus sp. KBS0724 TaxID=1179674 RepID=UPI00110DCFB5|nr:molybdopterin-dependent oxidoreductase [Rhodococcus sp. KBS0724]TSD45384.1 molybdopterin-dependent oxidoreductase [Rhodococcus sp. KBS0724]